MGKILGMEQKKILIPGGKTSDLALVNAAHKLGLYVITSGRDKTAPAHQFADQFVCADYSDKEAILRVVKDNRVDYICSSANDIALTTTTYVCEQMGLPGHDSYETTLTLHHKDRFKALAKQLNLHVPEGESFSEINAAIHYAQNAKYKIIVKPVDLVGGNGLSIPKTSEEIAGAVEKAFNASLSKRIVIEQFIDGSSHSFSTFIIDGSIALYYSDNEYSFGKNFKISTSAGPADGFDQVKDILFQDTEKVAKALHLVDGRLHIQYIMENGIPYILEMTRRTSGDLYSVPASLSLGFNTPIWIVRAECGMDVHAIPKNAPAGRYGRHCIMPPHPGVTDGIVLHPSLESCVYRKWLWGAYHHQVTDPENDCIGLLFLKFDSEKEIVDIVHGINDLITVQYE